MLKLRKFLPGWPLLAAAVLTVLVFSGPALAAAFPHELGGKWYQAPAGWVYPDTPDLHDPALIPLQKVTLTGGRFFRASSFTLKQAIPLVVAFKNTQTIAHFQHWLYDEEGKLLARAEGGMLSQAPNPFFLAFGREFELPAGRYHLVTEVDSPFYIAQPQPYLDTLAHYRQAIKLPAAAGMLCLGILFGLGTYYFTLSLARRNLAEGMYALFITGNLIFDSASMLALPDLLGIRSFALLGLPILITNAVYIVFVLSLLNIKRASHPRLHRAGLGLIGLLSTFIVLGLFMPHWSLELERAGVAVFLLFGMVCGIVRVREGDITARFYLAAVSLFFVLGGITISASTLHGIYTMHVEHLGTFAVTAEVLALALVLSYQFAQLKYEKDDALSKHAESLELARTDALTNLPNRLALEADLTPLPPQGCLTFIDMDGLKYYNDRYGHDRGDDLLRGFADKLRTVLGKRAKVYRLGGDEFAVIGTDNDDAAIAQAIQDALIDLRSQGFEQAAASYGTAHIGEVPARQHLMNLADRRMYENKFQNRARTGPRPALSDLDESSDTR